MDFVCTVRRVRAAPIPGTDGLHLMAVIDAACRSATTGEAIDIDEPTSTDTVVAPAWSPLGSVVAGG